MRQPFGFAVGFRLVGSLKRNPRSAGSDQQAHGETVNALAGVLPLAITPSFFSRPQFPIAGRVHIFGSSD